MANLSGSERANYVREMFSEIAPRYDLMNRLMTFGQDVRWRSLVIRRAEIPRGGRLLDLGSGTGDLAQVPSWQLDRPTGRFRSPPCRHLDYGAPKSLGLRLAR